MSTTTTNYGLIKPDTTDPILIGQLNDNSDAIDAALKENADAIENKPDAADIPTPSTAAPAMDGTAAAGTSTDYARADHIHPSDTSKQDALTTSQLAAVNSGIDSEKVEQIETNKNNITTLMTWTESGNRISPGAYHIDLNNSSVIQRLCEGQRRVVILIDIIFSDTFTPSDNIRPLANITSNSFIPSHFVYQYLITDDYTFKVWKNNSNQVVGMAVTSGTIPANTNIVMQFEYTY